MQSIPLAWKNIKEAANRRKFITKNDCQLSKEWDPLPNLLLLMNPSPKVQILLPTYNCFNYIDDFFQSLISQTYENWTLLVRDDGSIDGTQYVLQKWKNRLKEKIEILPDSGQVNLRCNGNYSRLLAMSSSSYVMLADPDDVWNPDKIEVTLNAMLKLESSVCRTTPCLVHTDLTIVDECLHVKSESFWKYQGLYPERRQELSRMLVENTVCACTTMINRSLVELAGEAPECSIHVDWWLALVAATFGRIASVPIQTILWRRHGSNASEISSLKVVTKATVASPKGMRQKLLLILADNRLRAESFLERYKDRLSRNQLDTLLAFIEISSKGPLIRRWKIIKHRLFFTSNVRNIGLLLLV